MGSPQPGTPDFSLTLVLPHIFNCLNFECIAFSVLKVDSSGRKRKSRKEEKKQEK